MGENSKIEWTDHTFNPWIGCSKVSAGCIHCYAERDFDHRKGWVKWGPSGTRSVTKNWHKPVQWNGVAAREGKRQKVFCASLADVFEDWSQAMLDHEGRRLWVSDEEPDRWVAERPKEDLLPIELQNIEDGTFRLLTMHNVRARLFRLIDRTPHLDWLLLTKRPENIMRMLPAYMPNYVAEAGTMNQEEIRENLWIGTNVENQAEADKRIPELLKIPAAVRFLSCEPLLGPVDIGMSTATCKCCPRWSSRWVELQRAVTPDFPLSMIEKYKDCRAEPGLYLASSNMHGALSVSTPGGDLGIKPAEFTCLPKIDWIIIGGESGSKARPMHPTWVRSIRDQCQDADVPFYFKQWGEWAPRSHGFANAGKYRWGTHDGKQFFESTTPWNGHDDDGSGEAVMVRVGKQRAGCLLDGREWKEFPQ